MAAGITCDDAQAFAKFARRAPQWTPEENETATQFLTEAQHNRLSVEQEPPQ